MNTEPICTDPACICTPQLGPHRHIAGRVAAAVRVPVGAR